MLIFLNFWNVWNISFDLTELDQLLYKCECKEEFNHFHLGLWGGRERGGRGGGGVGLFEVIASIQRELNYTVPHFFKVFWFFFLNMC